MRFTPSIANAALKPRNNVSRVCFQNFRKNALTTSDAVTMTPSRKPSSMSVALEYQAVQQQQHGRRCGTQPQRIQADPWEQQKIYEQQRVRNRQADETQPAPQQQTLPDPPVGAQQEEGAKSYCQRAENVDDGQHRSPVLLQIERAGELAHGRRGARVNERGDRHQVTTVSRGQLRHD